jgi:hypothetical protein
VLAAGFAAFALMLATVGPRADLDSTTHLWWTAVKVLFAVSVIGAAPPLLLRSMRPGLEKKTHPEIIFTPLHRGHRRSPCDAAFLSDLTPGARCFAERTQDLRHGVSSASSSLPWYHTGLSSGRFVRPHQLV